MNFAIFKKLCLKSKILLRDPQNLDGSKSVISWHKKKYTINFHAFCLFFKYARHASMYGLFCAQVQFICTSFFIFLIIIWTLNHKDTLFFHAIALNFKCILEFQANICYYYFWTIVIPTFGCVYFQSKFANYYL